MERPDPLPDPTPPAPPESGPDDDQATAGDVDDGFTEPETDTMVPPDVAGQSPEPEQEAPE